MTVTGEIKIQGFPASLDFNWRLGGWCCEVPALRVSVFENLRRSPYYNSDGGGAQAPDESDVAETRQRCLEKARRLAREAFKAHR